MNHKPKMGHQTAIICWASAAMFIVQVLLGSAPPLFKVGFFLIGVALIIGGADAWISDL